MRGREDLEPAQFDLGAKAREQALQVSLAEMANRIGIKRPGGLPSASAATACVPAAPPVPSPRAFGMSLTKASEPLIPSRRPLNWSPAAVGGPKKYKFHQNLQAPSLGNALRVSASSAFQPQRPQALDRLAAAGLRRKSLWTPPVGLPRNIAGSIPPEFSERRLAAIMQDRAIGCPDVPAGRFSSALPIKSGWRAIAMDTAGVSEPGRARLGFTDMGFTSAPETPSRVAWVGLAPELGSGQEVEGS